MSIEPNVFHGVYGSFLGASDAVTNIDLPPTFVSTAEYPRAWIDHTKAGDDHLSRYFHKKGTFGGATVYIRATDVPIDDSQWQ